MRTGWHILQFGGMLLMALVFAIAGIGLIIKSSESADMVLGIFLVCLTGGVMYWSFGRRGRSREPVAKWDDPDSTEAVEAQAISLCQRGHYDRAEELAKAAIAAAESARGPDHVDVAARLSTLAMIYDTQGKYVLAEQLYSRALAINEKVLGPDDPDVATDLDNLAGLFRHTGRNAEAEAMDARVRAIRKRSR